MCLMRPAEVISVQGTMAVVDWQGQTMSVDTSLVGPVLPGERLLVHAGTALERVAPEEQDDLDALFADVDGAIATALDQAALVNALPTRASSVQRAHP